MSDYYPTWDELSEFEQLWSNYSDAHKDYYGFRPRPSVMPTLDELKSLLDVLYVRLNEQFEREDAEEKRLIATIVDMGAEDEETANRWLKDAWYDSNGYDPRYDDPADGWLESY